ncbi:MAG: GNAT family N-acetyltransferase [Burkholderiales bacterium]|nr:GNAT family N-acetyltransferase [Burkholderiales bacterium]MDE1926305.1 GNAT family N-acetyltransferase [Burkholderiales bacterium]MDE2159468.1 GNAT family N-acetyltransferase [Burkholderiales bacterium]MDE2501473.1 GNAT family N-acetyltransferase [Burkholderiales bacterium]
MAEPDDLLSRVEDAGLNASAPPQQRWLDGWILRFSPGQAKRARCVNAVALGRTGVDIKFQRASRAYAEAGLPLIFRVTPFSLPADLDAELERLGCTAFDDTRVMVQASLPPPAPLALPAGCVWAPLAGRAYAEALGALRGSTPIEIRAHAERLALSPVPYRGLAIRRAADGELLACAQFAREADLVGLYDVHTRIEHRGRGLGRLLCRRLLAEAAREGARSGYLQVDGGNEAARRIYRHLGFDDAYAYHYRQAPNTG